MNKNLIVGTFPTGYVYCDRSKEEHGDYMKIAMFFFDTLELKIYKPNSNLLEEIKEDVKRYKKGMKISISSTQTRILGV